MKWILGVTLAANLAWPALGNELINGNDLLDVCQNTAADNVAKFSFCSGYIIGIVEGNKFGAMASTLRSGVEIGSASEMDAFLSWTLGYCTPDNSDYNQIRDVIVDYLRANPSTRHESARGLAHLALIEAFPCD